MKAAPALLAFFLALPVHAGEVTQFESFRRAASLALEPLLTHVFGDDSVLAAVDRLASGDVLRFDTDGDGAVDALAWREGTTRVAALDEDHDLRPDDRRPDRDSDCYLADRDSDGILDNAVDYLDLDGDGKADRQDLYEIAPGSMGTPGVGVTVVFDLDRDGRFFDLTDYSYHANRNMWASDFDGNGCFVAGDRDEASGTWASAYENPFCFYDDDGDGRTDEALRFEGRDLVLSSMRWSFDADGDASPRSPHDFDFSATAVGRVRAPDSFGDSVRLRDGGTLRFVSWKRARDLALWGIWRSALLVWDEDDHNVAPRSEAPDSERWEGVIAESYMGFPQVGGPSCWRTNKRYELDRDGSGRLGLYLSAIDDRIHLLGAESGETAVLLPAQPEIRRSIRMADTDGNGFFDTWSWGSGVTGNERVRTVRFHDETVRMLPPYGPALRRIWAQELPAARDRSRWDREQIESLTRGRAENAVRRFWLRAREQNEPIVARAESSVETERFLEDLSLWEAGGGFLARDPESAHPAATWETSCLMPRARGLVLDATAIPMKAGKDLGPLSVVELVGPRGRVAGQVEDRDADGRADILYFPAAADSGDPAGSANATLEIGPAAPLRRLEAVRIDPWFGGGIAFEAAQIAYRTYEGRLDLFAKRMPGLILRTDLGDYHKRQPWGMDALDVGDGPGLAGLYILAPGDHWVPLFGAAGVDSQRVVAAGPLRAVIEVVLTSGFASGSGASRIVRTWTLEGGGEVIDETLMVEAAGSGDSVTIAAAIPRLSGHGDLEAILGIWSFGPSIPEAGTIGLAGACLQGERCRSAEIQGDPALVLTVAPGRTTRWAWIAGCEALGDTTSETWRRRASESLLARGAGARRCPVE